MRVGANSVGREEIDPREFITIDHLESEGTDFSGLRLQKLTVIGSKLTRCRFDKTTVTDASLGAGLEMSEYVECSFNGASLSIGGFARFVGCTFHDALLHDLRGHYLEFIGCTFSGTIQRTIFWGSPPPERATDFDFVSTERAKEGLGPPPESFRALIGRPKNEFHDNDFSRAEFDDVSFRGGVDLSLQRLPDGPAYIYVQDAERCLRRIVQLYGSGSAEESKAVAFVKVLFERNIVSGQLQLLLKDNGLAKRSTKPRPNVTLAYNMIRQCCDAS